MSLFRQTTAKAPPPEDPTSKEAWEAVREGARAAHACLDRECVTQECQHTVAAMQRRLDLTPASLRDRLRTKVPQQSSFLDYERVVAASKATCGALIASGTAGAEAMVLRINAALESYSKQVRRERTMERLSGESSEKRGKL